mmetsp:Transcript_26930/g.78503  ORF Transcript_26930/g.78503 Transcript_26930/m.78503 type:complete len:482 (+) Transcript_26930:4840-6285(+)
MPQSWSATVRTPASLSSPWPHRSIDASFAGRIRLIADKRDSPYHNATPVSLATRYGLAERRERTISSGEAIASRIRPAKLASVLMAELERTTSSGAGRWRVALVGPSRCTSTAIGVSSTMGSHCAVERLKTSSCRDDVDESDCGPTAALEAERSLASLASPPPSSAASSSICGRRSCITGVGALSSDVTRTTATSPTESRSRHARGPGTPACDDSPPLGVEGIAVASRTRSRRDSESARTRSASGESGAQPCCCPNASAGAGHGAPSGRGAAAPRAGGIGAHAARRLALSPASASRSSRAWHASICSRTGPGTTTLAACSGLLVSKVAVSEQPSSSASPSAASAGSRRQPTDASRSRACASETEAAITPSDPSKLLAPTLPTRARTRIGGAAAAGAQSAGMGGGCAGRSHTLSDSSRKWVSSRPAGRGSGGSGRSKRRRATSRVAAAKCARAATVCGSSTASRGPSAAVTVGFASAPPLTS